MRAFPAVIDAPRVKSIDPLIELDDDDAVSFLEYRLIEFTQSNFWGC